MWPWCAMTSKFGGLQHLLGMETCRWSFEQWHTGGYIVKRPLLSNGDEPPSRTCGWRPNLATREPQPSKQLWNDTDLHCLKWIHHLWKTDETPCIFTSTVHLHTLYLLIQQHFLCFYFLRVKLWSISNSGKALASVVVVDAVFWCLNVSSQSHSVETTSAQHGNSCRPSWQCRR